MDLGIPKVMKAIVYRGPDDLRLESIPVPRIKAGELLVKIAVCGVCPTDIKKIHYGTVPPPRVFGHESAGVIVKVGGPLPRSRGGIFRVGERVALHHHVPCLRCHFCRHRAFAQCAGYKRTGITAGFEPAGGGYAEYVRVMPFVLPGVVKIPPRNTFEEGAMLEPVNTVLKAVKRLNVLPGDNVLVAGQGPIGLMFTRILSVRGVRVVATDLMENRVKLALEWGAAKSFSAEDKRLGAKIRSAFPVLDAAVITVPATPVVLEAVELVRGSGQVLLFAHTRKGDQASVDLASVCLEEKDLIGSYSSDFTLQKEAARLVFSRTLDVRQLITHHFPLAETAAAVALASRPTPNSLKIVTCSP
jgi:L-iditol 2-dehydrogenase